MPGLDRSTLSRPRCARCGYMHAPDPGLPCPRAFFWLIAGTPVDQPYPLMLLGTRAKRVTP